MRLSTAAFTIAIFASVSACRLFAADAKPQELVLILDDPPVASKFAHSAADRNGLEMQSWRAQLRSAQASVKQHLAAMKVPVKGSADTLINAVFVTAPMVQVNALRSIPGVHTVAIAPRLHRTLDKALDLQNVKQAWTTVGGAGKAGAGVKIAIIDSGIDQTHPGLQDSSLTAPDGFPKGDAGYTNTKVIAARSYVSMLSYPDPAYSTPDDNSPRDHVGHGTALAMIAAGNSVKAPVATISGVAPKAYLGNYKIFGSPGVNDFTSTAALVQALEDAFSDGMDIAVLSLGYPAFGAPLDQTTGCQQQTPLRSYIPATVCDVNAYVVEHAALIGMTVVVAAGNDGCSGLVCPTLGTINSPGTAPSAITVGSTTNAHVIFSQVRGNGQTFNGISGNGPRLNAPLTAKVVDVTSLGNDGNACATLPANSLNGSIALVTRGVCNFYAKVNNAQAAGAVAVLMYDSSSDNIFQPTFLLNETALPLEFVGVTAGTAIKNAVKGDANFTVTIDPTLTALDAPSDVVAFDSSRGPTIGNTQLKPEIAAVGSNVYTATQNYDPNGDSYDVSRYTSVDGTSFAAAMVAGAAALVKQAHPSYNVGQIKSALVNTATAGVVTDAVAGGLARVTAVGAGKLDAGSAVATSVTVSPQVVSFGQLTGLAGAVPISLTNNGTSPVTLSLSVARRDNDGNATVSISPSSITINAGQSQTANLSMTGRAPTAGTYEGQVNIGGGSVPLHIPYHYLVSDNKIANVYSLFGDYYFAAVSEYPDSIYMRITDQFGAPIVNAPVQWSSLGGGQVDQRNVDPATDKYGVAGATVLQSSNPGFFYFQGLTLGSFGWQFTEAVNFAPSISNGIFNAATQQTGSLAPGSYATISGIDFSTVPIIPNTPNLPISLGAVNVSFDAGGISVPAPISYMSFNQINIQIPWEMTGQTSATVKVNYHGISGPTVSLPLASVSPAYFEYTDTTNSQLSVVAQDANYQLITSQHAAVRGQPAVLYVNGLGPVSNTPPSGVQSSSTSLSRTTTDPVVTIGGQKAQVLFSGLTPQTVGLYQINVVVPANTPVGLQPLTVNIGGVDGKNSQIAVQ